VTSSPRRSRDCAPSPEPAYRPVAVVDHGPAVIRAMVEADETGDILFLYTRTTSPPARLIGPRIATRRGFDLTALVGKDHLPDQVQLVWHGSTTKSIRVSSCP
jgi:hypothetical protein